MSIPAKVCDRLASGMKQYAPIIEQQKTRDVSEADTVVLVRGLLADVFGYDRFTELTSEFAIRGRYCDIAIRLNNKVVQIIEVKAIGITLDERHLRQAVDYASNQGVEWIILTNGVIWRLYNVIFAKPIDKRLIAEMNLMDIDCRQQPDQELLYLFTKEGFLKGAHMDLRDRQAATSRFLIAALLLHNEKVLSAIRRELRRVVNVTVDDQDILAVLRDEVVKRDAMEEPMWDEAVAKVSGGEDRPLRTSRRRQSAPESSLAGADDGTIGDSNDDSAATVPASQASGEPANEPEQNPA